MKILSMLLYRLLACIFAGTKKVLKHLSEIIVCEHLNMIVWISGSDLFISHMLQDMHCLVTENRKLRTKIL